jgi:hypothetical protein
MDEEKSWEYDVDTLNLEYFFELYQAYGKTCNKCKWVQGTPKHGLKHWFCDHLTNKLERRQANRQKEAFKKMLGKFSGNVLD